MYTLGIIIILHKFILFNLLQKINPLNAELNPICHLLALAGAHHFVHVSRLRVNTSYEDSQKHALAFTNH